MVAPWRQSRQFDEPDEETLVRKRYTTPMAPPPQVPDRNAATGIQFFPMENSGSFGRRVVVDLWSDLRLDAQLSDDSWRAATGYYFGGGSE